MTTATAPLIVVPSSSIVLPEPPHVVIPDSTELVIDESAFVESSKQPTAVHNGSMVVPEVLQATPGNRRGHKPIDDFVAAAEPVDDFISSYTTWADWFEMPRGVHEAIAILLIAMLLNNSKIVILWGKKLTFDLWLAVFADSGMGKNASSDTAEPVIDAAGIAHLIDNSTWGSKEAFYQQMAGGVPTKFHVLEEFSSFMKKLESPAFSGVKGDLTNMFDNRKLPASIKYSQTGNTQEITFRHAPRTNFIALSSPDWFFENLRDSDATGGFLPRWTIVDALHNHVPRKVPKPKPIDLSRVPALAKALQLISKLAGPVEFFEGFDAEDGPYYKWYDETSDRFEKADSKFGGIFWRRHRVTALKLAVIYEASMSRTLRVSPEAWERTVAKLAELEATLFRLFGTGMTSFGQKCKEAEELLWSGGEKGIPQSELTRHFQDWRVRDAVCRYLKDSGIGFKLQREREPGRRGPAPDYWFHKEFIKTSG
jgi:hypothetical protein